MPKLINKRKITFSDVIIILGYPVNNSAQLSDVLYSRLDYGVKLFHSGFAKNVILTGAAVNNSYVEAEAMAAYCIKKGIPAESIILEKKARNTYENALYCSRLMKQMNMSKAIIVTSIFHKERAKYLFSKFITEYEVSAAGFPESFPFMKQLLFLFKEKLIMLWYIFIGDEWLYKHTTKQLKQRRNRIR